jgi:hypothetical protein
MLTRAFFVIYFLFSAGVCFCQTQQKPAVKTASSELKKLLSSTGLPYKMVNDDMAVIPYGGANIASYNVIVQKVSDLYIVYANLTEALPGKINGEKYKYLLQQNDHFDIIKIGMSSEDNTVYVRADIYKISATSPLLNRIVKQVANVTNIIGGDLIK